ncbi:HNH endonuclease signature motif containing protein, partial [Actinomadura adrarensis]
RELSGLRDHLKASGRDHALPFRIARAAHDIHDRLTELRESWCRSHDPEHGRTVYRPTPSLRQAIERRHVACAFPTCNRRSDRCDIDHTVPWGRGKSCRCNLAPLCRKHHRTKQTPGWRLIQPWPGLLIWVTPSGQWHITLPTRE